MKNWVIVLLIFILPLSLYGYLEAKANSENSCKLPELEAQSAPQSESKAKIIKFSSPMCSECVQTAAEMKKAMVNHKDDVILEEINIMDTSKEAKANTKAAIKKYQVSVVPTIIFIDKKGNIVLRQEGLIKSDQIAKVIDEIK